MMLGTPPKSSSNSAAKDLRQAHFSFGGYKHDGKSLNQSNYCPYEIPKNVEGGRAELKARMAKTSFTFGNKA